MEYKKHGVAGVEGGPEGQRTQACLFLITFEPKIASVYSYLVVLKESQEIMLLLFYSGPTFCDRIFFAAMQRICSQTYPS